jgi:hypothetical protein
MYRNGRRKKRRYSVPLFSRVQTKRGTRSIIPQTSRDILVFNGFEGDSELDITHGRLFCADNGNIGGGNTMAQEQFLWKFDLIYGSLERYRVTNGMFLKIECEL